MKSREVILGYWALAAIAIFWGTTWFVSKLAIKEIPPLQLCALRQTTAGLFFILYFFVYKKIKLPSWKEMIFHVLLGFLFFTISNGLTTFAIKYIPSFLGALIGCLMPFVLVLLGLIFYNERIKPITLFALTIGFLGIGSIIFSFREQMILGSNFSFGILITLLTVFTWTGGSLISTRNKWGYEGKYGIGWQMFYGGLMLFIFSFVAEKQVALGSLSLHTWAYMAYLTIIGSIFCFQCYLYALKHLPLSLVSVYVYINPIVALLLGVLLLNESFNLQIVVGAIVTFIGIYMVKKYAD